MCLKCYKCVTDAFMYVQSGPKHWIDLRVDNFAVVIERKACDMS